MKFRFSYFFSCLGNIFKIICAGALVVWIKWIAASIGIHKLLTPDSPGDKVSALLGGVGGSHLAGGQAAQRHQVKIRIRKRMLHSRAKRCRRLCYAHGLSSLQFYLPKNGERYLFSVFLGWYREWHWQAHPSVEPRIGHEEAVLSAARTWLSRWEGLTVGTGREAWDSRLFSKKGEEKGQGTRIPGKPLWQVWRQSKTETNGIRGFLKSSDVQVTSNTSEFPSPLEF